MCTQLLDELSKELEELRAFKLQSEGMGRARSSSLPRSQRRELEAHIVRLKEVSVLRQSLQPVL